MFHVYILYSVQFDKIYVDFTSDLEARFKSHNELATKGWTAKFRPWKIVYQESFELKSAAMRRERELKSAQGRAFIRSQIIAQLS